MFATKRRFITTALAITVFFSLVGTLAFTLVVFAGGELQEHDKSNTHIHTKNGQSENSSPRAQWTVQVGKLNWSSAATYVWHKLVITNNISKTMHGEWEWNHEVESDNGWNDDDTYVTSYNYLRNDSLIKTGWSSVDLPNRRGKYWITAYTRVAIFYGNENVTRNIGKDQVDIKSLWFEK